MNIILQHYDGQLPNWGIFARDTMIKYAEAIGAKYELVTGNPVGWWHGPYAQKMVMLDEKYDEYEQVLMLDMDIAATNVYTDVITIPQIGVLHSRAMTSPKKAKNGWETSSLYKQGSHLFFGNFIKLPKDMRVELRKYLDWPKFNLSIGENRYGSDELILHYLFWNSGILKNKTFYEICMRRDGTSLDDIHIRSYDRFDRKFGNLPEESDHDASLIHFCANRKRNLIKTIKAL